MGSLSRACGFKVCHECVWQCPANWLLKMCCETKTWLTVGAAGVDDAVGCRWWWFRLQVHRVMGKLLELQQREGRLHTLTTPGAADTMCWVT